MNEAANKNRLVDNIKRSKMQSWSKNFFSSAFHI